jgi:hypothetical protein
MWSNQQKHNLENYDRHVLLVASQILLGSLLFVNQLVNSVQSTTHRLLDINVTKTAHSTLQQIDPARN